MISVDSISSDPPNFLAFTLLPFSAFDKLSFSPGGLGSFCANIFNFSFYSWLISTSTASSEIPIAAKP